MQRKSGDDGNQTIISHALARERTPEGQEKNEDDGRPPCGLEGAFTRYVRSLDGRREPAAERFDEMWRALGAAVVRELRKSSLWRSPPSYLGLSNGPSWYEGSSGPGRAASPLDELLVDCYSFIFLKRLPRLRAQLEVKPEIDGLVFLYLRNYLHDRRKAHDPLGFRVFETLRIAVRQAVSAGELHLVAGEEKIRNNSVLAARAAADPRRARAAAVLRPIVERWNDELLPGMMTARGKQRRELIRRLRRRLAGLEAEGVEVFRFKDLIDPLKRDFRARWAALFEAEAGAGEDAAGGATIARLAQPDRRVEEMDSCTKLASHVADHLERLDAPVKTRHYLTTLWEFLRLYAFDERFEDLPSNRRLAAMLQIPRERLPGLYETLRELVGEVQTRLALPLGLLDEMSHNAPAASSRSSA